MPKGNFLCHVFAAFDKQFSLDFKNESKVLVLYTGGTIGRESHIMWNIFIIRALCWTIFRFFSQAWLGTLPASWFLNQMRWNLGFERLSLCTMRTIPGCGRQIMIENSHHDDKLWLKIVITLMMMMMMTNSASVWQRWLRCSASRSSSCARCKLESWNI